MMLFTKLNEYCRYERISWFPVLITLVIASAIGGKHLSNPPPAIPATASAVLGFASSLAGFSITYSPLSSDFTCYYRPNVSRYEIQILEKLLLKLKIFASWKIFLSSYAGLLLSIVRIIQSCLYSFLHQLFLLCQISLQCLGAAVAVAVSSVPAWEQGYAGGNVGGLLEAMLSPLGNFGKFLMVLLSLSVAGNNVASFYSISINLQVFIPILAAVPRYVFSVVATAM
jgi:purine-cytosine permease-like protein